MPQQQRSPCTHAQCHTGHHCTLSTLNPHERPSCSQAIKCNTPLCQSAVDKPLYESDEKESGFPYSAIKLSACLRSSLSAATERQVLECQSSYSKNASRYGIQQQPPASTNVAIMISNRSECMSFNMQRQHAIAYSTTNRQNSTQQRDQLRACPSPEHATAFTQHCTNNGPRSRGTTPTFRPAHPIITTPQKYHQQVLLSSYVDPPLRGRAQPSGVRLQPPTYGQYGSSVVDDYSRCCGLAAGNSLHSQSHTIAGPLTQDSNKAARKGSSQSKQQVHFGTVATKWPPKPTYISACNQRYDAGRDMISRGKGESSASQVMMYATTSSSEALLAQQVAEQLFCQDVVPTQGVKAGSHGRKSTALPVQIPATIPKFQVTLLPTTKSKWAQKAAPCVKSSQLQHPPMQLSLNDPLLPDPSIPCTGVALHASPRHSDWHHTPAFMPPRQHHRGSFPPNTLSSKILQDQLAFRARAAAEPGSSSFVQTSEPAAATPLPGQYLLSQDLTQIAVDLSTRASFKFPEAWQKPGWAQPFGKQQPLPLPCAQLRLTKIGKKQRQQGGKKWAAQQMLVNAVQGQALAPVAAPGHVNDTACGQAAARGSKRKVRRRKRLVPPSADISCQLPAAQIQFGSALCPSVQAANIIRLPTIQAGGPQIRRSGDRKHALPLRSRPNMITICKQRSEQPVPACDHRTRPDIRPQWHQQHASRDVDCEQDGAINGSAGLEDASPSIKQSLVDEPSTASAPTTSRTSGRREVASPQAGDPTHEDGSGRSWHPHYQRMSQYGVDLGCFLTNAHPKLSPPAPIQEARGTLRCSDECVQLASSLLEGQYSEATIKALLETIMEANSSPGKQADGTLPSLGQQSSLSDDYTLANASLHAQVSEPTIHSPNARAKVQAEQLPGDALPNYLVSASYLNASTAYGSPLTDAVNAAQAIDTPLLPCPASTLTWAIEQLNGGSCSPLFRAEKVRPHKRGRPTKRAQIINRVLSCTHAVSQASRTANHKRSSKEEKFLLWMLQPGDEAWQQSAPSEHLAVPPANNPLLVRPRHEAHINTIAQQLANSHNNDTQGASQFVAHLEQIYTQLESSRLAGALSEPAAHYAAGAPLTSPLHFKRGTQSQLGDVLDLTARSFHGTLHREAHPSSPNEWMQPTISSDEARIADFYSSFACSFPRFITPAIAQLLSLVHELGHCLFCTHTRWYRATQIAAHQVAKAQGCCPQTAKAPSHSKQPRAQTGKRGRRRKVHSTTKPGPKVGQKRKQQGKVGRGRGRRGCVSREASLQHEQGSFQMEDPGLQSCCDEQRAKGALQQRAGFGASDLEGQHEAGSAKAKRKVRRQESDASFQPSQDKSLSIQPMTRRRGVECGPVDEQEVAQVLTNDSDEVKLKSAYIIEHTLRQRTSKADFAEHSSSSDLGGVMEDSVEHETYYKEGAMETSKHPAIKQIQLDAYHNIASGNWIKGQYELVGDDIPLSSPVKRKRTLGRKGGSRLQGGPSLFDGEFFNKS